MDGCRSESASKMLRIVLPLALLLTFFGEGDGIIFPAIASLVNSFFHAKKDPTLYYSSEDFICDSGYPVETHKVETEDGYILSVQRIPSGRKNQISNRVRRNIRRYHYGLSPEFPECRDNSTSDSGRTSGRTPVLVQHGFTVSSDSWLFQGPKYDLPYLLADAGYDVWLGNSRGNYYSRSHRSLDPSDPRFWDFSYHEMGYYDLPAIIDYILEQTGSENLHYVGHSMGCTMFFVMAATRPEYNEKIRLFTGLAPAAFFSQENMPSRKKVIVNTMIKAIRAFQRNGATEILPRVNWVPYLSNAVCRRGAPFQDLCSDFLFFWSGVQTKSTLRDALPRIITHAPAGFSLKTMAHFMQGFLHGNFSQYDYKADKNLEVYGQENPPEYDLSLVTCPASIYYSSIDYVTDGNDVIKLIESLPRVVNIQKTNKLNHADFQWSSKAKSVVYSHAIRTMGKY